MGEADLLVGSRALALGGAFVALADDATAALWNPAGLGRLEGVHLLGGLQGHQQQGGGEEIRGGRGKGWLLGVTARLGVGAVGAIYAEGEGGELFIWGAGLAPGERLALGVALKSKSMGNRSSSSYDLSLGVLLRALLGLSLGASFDNLMSWDTYTRVGAALKLAWLSLAGEVRLTPAGEPSWCGGVEFRPLASFISVRAGRAPWGWGVGAGLESARLKASFAFIALTGGGGGNQWHLSTEVVFGLGSTKT